MHRYLPHKKSQNLVKLDELPTILTLYNLNEFSVPLRFRIIESLLHLLMKLYKTEKKYSRIIFSPVVIHFINIIIFRGKRVEKEVKRNSQGWFDSRIAIPIKKNFFLKN